MASNLFRHYFQKTSACISDFVGTPLAFALSMAMIIAWALWAAPQGFSQESQMPINSSTTIITFLMTFILASAQNRHSAALHLKLDELIRVQESARNEIIHAEEKDDDDLKKLRIDA